MQWSYEGQQSSENGSKYQKYKKQRNFSRWKDEGKNRHNSSRKKDQTLELY